MIEVMRCRADAATSPQRERSIQRGVVKLKPSGQQRRAYMPSERMISAHNGRVSLVHRAQNPGVLLKVTSGGGEFMLFHQQLLRSENLLHPIQ